MHFITALLNPFFLETSDADSVDEMSPSQETLLHDLAGSCFLVGSVASPPRDGEDGEMMRFHVVLHG